MAGIEAARVAAARVPAVGRKPRFAKPPGSRPGTEAAGSAPGSPPARLHFDACLDVLVIDPDGEEHPSLAAGIDAARQIARELIADAIRCGQPVYSRHAIRVRDAGGTLYAEVPFGDVIDLR